MLEKILHRHRPGPWLLNKFGLRRQGTTTLSAKIIRADGTVEDLGVISRGKITLPPRGNASG
jgi:hypothetical protein